MMRTVRLAIALVTAGVASGLVGCGESDDTKVVGFAQAGQESSWRMAETRSIREEAARRGYRLELTNAQNDQANQIGHIRSFIRQGVDVILLAPQRETGWDEVLAEARAAKIPVVLVDRGVRVADEGLYVTKIASDFVAEGRMAGRWLVKRLGGKGRIAELRGSDGSSPAAGRAEGFRQAIANHDEMKIVDSRPGRFQRTEGKKAMADFLASGQKIDAVYAHNDDMALGAIEAIQAAGLAPGKDIVLISIDGVRGAFEAMKAGTLNATVECNPLLGPLTFDTIDSILSGRAVPKHVEVKDRLFEQADAAKLLPTRKY